jgi:hypothetical protein
MARGTSNSKRASKKGLGKFGRSEGSSHSASSCWISPGVLLIQNSGVGFLLSAAGGAAAVMLHIMLRALCVRCGI